MVIEINKNNHFANIPIIKIRQVVSVDITHICFSCQDFKLKIYFFQKRNVISLVTNNSQPN